MLVISNTTPLILFSRIDRLDILQHLFHKLLVPSAVQHEITDRHDDAAARLIPALDWIIEKSPVMSPETAASVVGLHSGEAAVIALAMEHRPPITVLLDDGRARKRARTIGLSVVGSAGILVLAKDSGVIASVRPLLDLLRSAGLYLDDRTYHDVLIVAAEME